jgi:glycosyltransferase involved in cell wall biosynthesis
MSSEHVLPKLVVIIPTNNRRLLLERALKSVQSQAYKNYRIVVINDGSTDGTRKYLDSLHDEDIEVIHFEKNRGVNAARNAGLRTVQQGEWAVRLDDDDIFLPDGLGTIAHTLSSLPADVEVACFNIVVQTAHERFVGGLAFKEGESYRDVSYEENMLGLSLRGGKITASKWTLFPKYLYSEDVSGLEREWTFLVARDGVKTRYFPQQVAWVDLAHDGEHLRFAIRRQRAAFARGYMRISRDHAAFFATHPETARKQARDGFKLAIRGLRPLLAILFMYLYLKASVRLFLNRVATRH